MCHDNDLHCTFTQPLHRSTEQQHIAREDTAQVPKRLMPARGICGHEGTNVLQTWNRHWQSQLSLACTLTLKGLSPALSTPCLLRLVTLLISIDWLWNLLKVTLLYTDSSASPSVKPGSKALVQNREKTLNSLPSISVTCDTHWETAFKELNRSHI